MREPRRVQVYAERASGQREPVHARERPPLHQALTDPHPPLEAPPRRSRPAAGIIDAIGDTPLVALGRLLGRRDVRAWAKLEAANPGGSAKDRPAARMVEDALADGSLAPGGTVVESSSGNLGVGLAQACRYHGLRLVCVVDTRANPTNVRMMRALGADVRVVTRPDPATGELLGARLALVADLLREIPGALWTDQYASRSNPAAHAAGTMREIDEALDGSLDHLLVATGTTGTLRGCADYLRAHGRATRIVAVDAVGSTLFGGSRGRRVFPGMGSGVPGALARDAWADEVIRVSDLDCIVGCRRLAEREAILAGASGGGLAVALERLSWSMAPGDRCAVILPDGGRGYLETVYDDEWVERALGVTPERLARLVSRDEVPIRGA
jgi:cysteine synthase A